MRSIFAILFLTLAPSTALGKDGKELFLASKCNKCHTVESQGIAQLPVAGTEEPSKKPVDLSKIGNEHDAAFVRSWLLREVADEGKKHKAPKFKGTDAELGTLADWVAALK